MSERVVRTRRGARRHNYPELTVILDQTAGMLAGGKNAVTGETATLTTWREEWASGDRGNASQRHTTVVLVGNTSKENSLCLTFFPRTDSLCDSLDEG